MKEFCFYTIAFTVSHFFETKRKCHFQYGYILLVDSAGLIGVIISSFVNDTLGRKISQILFYGLCSCAMFFFGTFKSSFMVSVILILFAKSFIWSGSAVSWSQTPELFHTDVSIHLPSPLPSPLTCEICVIYIFID